MTNGFIRTLDAVANRTGIPALAEGRPRRRLLRWTPLVALTLACAGLTVAFLSSGRNLYLGQSLLVVGFTIGTFCQLYGPIKPWGTTGETVDEWDRDLRRRAFLAGFAAMALAGLALFWTIAAAAALRNWSGPDMAVRAMGCAFFLMALHGTVPTLYASWATRPLDPADDEA